MDHPDAAPHRNPDGPVEDFRECSVAATVAVCGDKWLLLALRDISAGVRRFEQIVRSTGAPRDVLTARLRKLEADGILRRQRYSDRPPRYEYLLTDRGYDLVPVLLALRQWGDKHVPGRPPTLVEHSCGATFVPRLTCDACEQPVRPGTLAVTFVDPGADPRRTG